MAAAQRAIQGKIAAGDFYDAQQMVKTVYRRLCAKGQAAAACGFCVEAAGRLNAAGQHDLAADLGRDLVDFFEASAAQPSDENVEFVEAVLAGVPAGEAVVQKYGMLHRALKWSAAAVPNGHPRLHKLAARSYWAEKAYGKCQAHFVYCQDGPGLAEMVFEWRKCGYPTEEDLFLLRTLLMLLSLGDLATARSFWEAAAGEAALRPPGAAGTAGAASAACPGGVEGVEGAATAGERGEARLAEAPEAPAEGDAQEEGNPPAPPLQCGSFMLAAAEARSLDFFRAVRAKYMLVLLRDVALDKLVDEIEVRVFSAQRQRGGIGALFEALLGGGGGGGGGGGPPAAAGR